MARVTTPLLAGHLPGPNVTHDHPPHLRVTHSPWNWMPQSVLVKCRTTFVGWLSSSGILLAIHRYKEFRDHPIWFLIFHFGTVTFVLHFVFQMIVFLWTFHHMYHPHIDSVQGRVSSAFVRATSLPSDLGNPKKQERFHMFYSTTAVFSWMNAILYWFVTRPHNPDASAIGGPFTDLFGHGWLRSFAIFTTYTMPAITMLIETMFFNSIKRPQSPIKHMFKLSAFSVLYIIWGVLGGHLSGCYPFYWLNPMFVGGIESVVAHCMGFVALAPLTFIMVQGLIALREGLTAPARLREV
ncbi:hypothetical protein MY4824_006430 [Beauveria thailandica]